MPVQLNYISEGMLFDIQCEGKAVELPLRGMTDALARDDHWVLINTLSQWSECGFLESRGDGNYLLKPDNFYELTSEDRELLPIPDKAPNLAIREVGTIGSPEYAIQWQVLIRGVPFGRSLRRGCAVFAGKYEYILTQEQYKLLEVIASAGRQGSIQQQARFQAKCKYLARKANARLDKFTESRDFLFANEIECRPVLSPDDQQISFQPVIPELKDHPALAAQVSSQSSIGSSAFIYQNGRRTQVFIDAAQEQKFNEIQHIPPVCGKDIPRFIKNPLEFLPESPAFSSEEFQNQFAERVRGLKVRTARAMPYLNVRTAEDGKAQGSWLDILSGYKLEDEQGNDNDLTGMPEVSAQIAEAAQRGENCIYANGQWIEFDPDKIVRFEAARQKNGLSDGSARLPASMRQLILDIYDNLEGVDYSEASAQRLPEPKTFAPIPSGFRGQLLQHQRAGYTFMLSNYKINRGVLLADDMGLGKTVQVIALLTHLKEAGALPAALIVVPSSLTEKWKNEILKFSQNISDIYIHQGPARLRTPEAIGAHEVVLTTYETLARDQMILGLIKWSCVISDESQKIKNFKTLAANAIKGMNTPFRIAMTGTPVENRLAELWTIADFVQPGMLGSYKNFRDSYEVPICQGNETAIQQLLETLAPIYLRRTKEEVLELPPKEEIRVPLELNKIQIDLIGRSIADYQKNNKNGTALLPTIGRMIQICSHLRLVDDNGLPLEVPKAAALENESPKLEWLVERLREIRRRGEKALVFTRYKRMQALLKRVLWEEFALDAAIINGDIHSGQQRQEKIDLFNQHPGFHALILSPAAAGVGLDITSANHVVHFCRVWNPAVENQATDRAYRIGQERTVYVYYPIMRAPGIMTASPEERLDSLMCDKRELMKNVVIPGSYGKDISAEDFEDLMDDFAASAPPPKRSFSFSKLPFWGRAKEGER